MALPPVLLRPGVDIVRGSIVAQAANALAQQGCDPALVIAHAGWGEAAFIKDVFPKAKLIVYAELFNKSEGIDVGFDPEFPSPDLAEKVRIRALNAGILLTLPQADAIVSATHFQADTHPEGIRERITVIHEGVETTAIQRNPDAKFTLKNSRILTNKDKVVTLINRQFEPMRGYHIFMRALPKMMEDNPSAQFVLIGADTPNNYGVEAPRGTTWAKMFLNEVKDKIDVKRLHFVGTLPHDQMLALLSISGAHVYYTYPFVLSWSLLEAMASEAPIIASATPPVQEVLRDGVNARLMPFFDPEALANEVTEALKNPSKFDQMRLQAREDVVRKFDRVKVCLPAWQNLIDGLLE